MPKVFLFCMVGKHGGPKVSDSGRLDVKIEGVRDWRLLPVSLKDDEWYYDPTSPASIWVCPNCVLAGEPRSN